jgi:peptide/nickel transport system substrate-binding protein/oligopeptide transport system substrate-binding protein
MRMRRFKERVFKGAGTQTAALHATQIHATQIHAGAGQGAHGWVELVRALPLLLGLLPLLLASCGMDSAATSAPAKDQTFTWPYVGAKKIGYGQILDPASVYRLDDTPTVQMLFAGLVTLERDLRVAPDAATSWDIDQTGMRYTFHLRPNMHFSDGQPLTAKDFAYSIDRALDPRLCDVFDAQTYGPDSPQGDGVHGSCIPIATGYLQHVLGATAKIAAGTDAGTAASGSAVPALISSGDDPSKGLNIIDPLTLVIRLDAPVSYFLEALTYPTALALEQSFVEKPEWAGGRWVDHLDQGGCSGPFQVSSYGDGAQMTLTPSVAWQEAWGKHLQLQRVLRPLVYNGDDAYTNYRAGKYDYVVVPGTSYNTARGQGDFHEVPTLQTRFIGLNWAKPPFDNLQVRQAFAFALNKQILVDRIEQGAGNPTNHFVPRGMPGYDAALENAPPDRSQSLTGNQTAATTLLKQAQDSCPQSGIFTEKRYAYCRYIVSVGGNPPLPITISYRQVKPVDQALTQGASEQWRNTLGLAITAAPLDDKQFFGASNLPAAHNSMQAWFLGWSADYPDPQDWLSLFFRTPTGSSALYNWSGASDPDVDQLLDDADKELNYDKRMGMYHQVEQWAIDQGGVIPISQEKASWRQRPWVSGFALTPIQTMIDTNWPNVVILAHEGS